MHKSESVLENETYKIPLKFEIQTDYLILDWRPDLVIINFKKRENLQYSGFCRTKDGKSKKERNVIWPYQTTKKIVEHWGDGDTICDWCTWNDSQRFGKRAGSVKNRRMNRDYPARILRRILDTCRDLLSFRDLWNSTSWRWCEGLASIKIIRIIII